MYRALMASGIHCFRSQAVSVFHSHSPNSSARRLQSSKGIFQLYIQGLRDGKAGYNAEVPAVCSGVPPGDHVQLWIHALQ